jgi:hypothetical protein
MALGPVSCPAAGSCVATGRYNGTSHEGDNVYNYGVSWHGSLAGKKLPAPVTGITADPATGGYWITTSKGNVYNFDAPFHGSTAGKKLPSPVVGITADGAGYLLVTKAGNVYNFDASWYGSLAGRKLPEPIAGIAVTG